MTLWKDEDNYRILTNKDEIQELTTGFIFFQSNKGLLETLKNFSEKRGSSIEFVGFLFKNEMDKFGQAYENLADDQVLLSADYPAASEDCEAYLNFDEFYQYFESGFDSLVKEYPDRYNEPEIRKALKALRESLGIEG